MTGILLKQNGEWVIFEQTSLPKIIQSYHLVYPDDVKLIESDPDPLMNNNKVVEYTLMNVGSIQYAVLQKLEDLIKLRQKELMMKKILYVDMDGVIADFDAMIRILMPTFDELPEEERGSTVDRLCQLHTRMFDDLPVIDGALEAIRDLSEDFDIYFLSTPMWDVPESYMDKRRWLERHFGELGNRKLILTHRKDLARGHFLVDDRLKHGVEDFEGEHIHFRTPLFPDWKTTVKYLKSKI